MKLILLLAVNLISFIVYSQNSNYWQQQVNYDIAVTLDDKEHTLEGFSKMQYINNSPDSLRFLWLHLWPNAFKNDRTAYTSQALQNGSTAFYFTEEENKGYINRLNFTVNGSLANVEDHPQHQDIIKLVLPQTLAPGGTIIIETPFHIKLPFNFSRGGHIDQSYHITQWFPKAAVYDRKGWHPMPYVDQGEFYSDFGNYNVNITVPQQYVVASTGTLKNESKEQDTKTLNYVQENVHDFAWFADKNFIVLQDTLQLATKTIQVFAYHLPETTGEWANSIQNIKSAVRTKSEWLGEYPYDVVRVVERPDGNGGMEYPTITLISTQDDEKLMDFLINHEVGHNWFYGILATNERIHPWMDEGMNSYYDRKYSQQQYGTEGISLDVKKPFLQKRLPEDFEDILLRTMISLKKDQPIETHSEDFSALNYNAIAYTKAAHWMKVLETEVSTETFNQIMKTYYNRWKFKHPYPEDFKSIAEELHKSSLDSTFSLLQKQGSLHPQLKRALNLTSFFSLKETDKFNYVFLAPAIGYNFYDKLMIGGLIHNYTLPPNRFQFFFAPMYATGSKQLNGLGKLNYTIYPGNNRNKLQLGLAGSRFSMDSFTDSTNKKNFLEFMKLVPSVSYTFNHRDPRSTLRHSIQYKAFLISERSYLFTRDNNTQEYIITYPLKNRSLHQLNLTRENNRKLYPYRVLLQGEKAEGFVKINFTTEYYFNYPKAGGLNVRLFAGKFFYTGKSLNPFETYRYHLNMTGSNGFEDYTYSNYFIGRNEFEGFLSQQLMIKDGGFKVRTDLLSNKFGRSDDWLTAINLTTTIPKKIFPLPIKLFADIGTYAEAWEEGAQTGKFVYDAGFQVSLLKNVVNVYIPVLYSKAYKEYYKSYIPEQKFRKSISFSIDIQNISVNRFFPQSPF